MDRIEWLKTILDEGKVPEGPRKRWRKMQQRNPRKDKQIMSVRVDPENQELVLLVASKGDSS